MTTMRLLYPLLVGGFSLLLTACIVRYRDFPQPALDRMPTPKKDSVIYYHTDPEAYYLTAAGGVIIGFPPPGIPMAFPADLPPVSQKRYRELSRAFTESNLVGQAIPATSPPEKGVYCAVNVKHKAPSDVATAFTVMTFSTWGVVPSYSGSSVDVVRFDLYVDQELQKIYRYEVRQDRWFWVGLLPFFWVNFLTTGTDEAYRAIVHQFFIDAIRDGYL